MENFALGRELAMTGTWYIYVTWRSNDSKICNHVDYMLVDGRHCTNLCDVRNMRGAEIKSGHFIMRAKIRFKIKRRIIKVK
jgi:endonuclease/exonuclease/phosphatase family metal-dependent hydrolase